CPHPPIPPQAQAVVILLHAIVLTADIASDETLLSIHHGLPPRFYRRTFAVASSAKERRGGSPGRSVSRLPHAEHRQETDHARHGDVIANPRDASARLQNLRERWRERGAEDAAEIVSAGRAGVAHGHRKELRQKRAKRR